jgi:hypothetical protein
MERLTRVVSLALFGAAAIVLMTLPAEAQGGGPSAAEAPHLQARAISGSINGTVIDESGAALHGAMVSVLGITLASTVTDERGQFTLNQLPAGDYLLRAHMLGFAASTGAMIRVGNTTPFQRVQLRRIDGAVATTGSGETPVKARPIIAAGFELPRGGDSASSDASGAPEHPHDEAAWWTRHVKRSILKDSASILVLTEDDTEIPTNGSLFGRAMGSAASAASSLFTDFPFSGEVNFLTTGAVAPGAMWSTTALPRGVAYLALAAPGAGGDWSIRAAMSQGDLSSWNVAGAYVSRPSGGPHKYDLGLSYSTQEYLGGNPAALAAVRDGSRNVGELYAFDEWTVSPALTLDYGARFTHYDYLQPRGLLSPRLGFGLEVLPETTVRVSVEQRMVAPGAEEFLATNSPGPWLPPERTFAPLGDPKDGAVLRAERARFFDVGVDRQLGDAVVVGVGRFHQSIDDQLVTIFGLGRPGESRSVGHYYVAGAGAVEADGWQVRLNTSIKSWLQGSVQYSRAETRWVGRGAQDLLRGAAPAAIRPDVEELHDLTTSLTADIRETATRVFVICKVNNGYVNPGLASPATATDARFGVQVNQALPVAFAGTKWEVLVGVRNLFRDPTDPASVYDELLVVRPPKRLVGGFLVRF